MPHPHSWATGMSWTCSTVSVYPPDYNVDNRAASTLNSDDARDEGDPFKPKNLFFLSLPLALPDTNAAGAYSLPRPSPRFGSSLLIVLAPPTTPITSVSGPMRSS